MEVDGDLSTALGIETLADRDMVPPGFDNTPGSSADALPIETFEHRRFLRVERSAILRSAQKVSKTWGPWDRMPSAYLPLKAKEDATVKKLNPFELYLLGQGEDGFC